MKLTVISSFVVALALIVPALFPISSAYAQSYMVVDLGMPGGFFTNSGAYSLPHGINSSGAVAGEWSNGGLFEHAFLYANGTNTDPGTLTGTTTAIANGINVSNWVVGECDGFSDTRAFLYTNGTMVDLTTYTQTVGNYTYSIAHAINAAGNVVGESFISSSGGDVHAVIFLGNHQQTDLLTLSNGTYSTAYGINNSNVIVGESTVASSTNVYAFIYSNGVMSAVGTLPGGNYSAAFAVNDSGEIVGEANDASGDTHAFIFKGGVMTDFGTFGGTNSSASAINSAGQVVGYALTASQDQHAFLYNGSTMLDLNNLISQSVCTNLVTADGINDAGQITGSGYTTGGILHAFLLTPALTLTASQMVAGQFQLTVQGVPGEQFILQGSTNLINWTPLVTNTLVSNSFNWVDAQATNWPCRFYRARQSP